MPDHVVQQKIDRAAVDVRDLERSAWPSGAEHLVTEKIRCPRNSVFARMSERHVNLGGADDRRQMKMTRDESGGNVPRAFAIARALMRGRKVAAVLLFAGAAIGVPAPVFAAQSATVRLPSGAAGGGTLGVLVEWSDAPELDRYPEGPPVLVQMHGGGALPGTDVPRQALFRRQRQRQPRQPAVVGGVHGCRSRRGHRADGRLADSEPDRDLRRGVPGEGVFLDRRDPPSRGESAGVSGRRVAGLGGEGVGEVTCVEGGQSGGDCPR